MSAKEMLRGITPPIAWDAIRKFKSPPPPNRSPHLPSLEGPFSSWQDAVTHSNGWDDPKITKKTLESALRVRDGHSEFEQDGVVRPNIIYSPTGLAFILLMVGRQQEGPIRVIDFGGGLGTHFYQHRKLFESMQRSFSWNVVERPDIVQLGKQHFETLSLRFFSEVADIQDATGFLSSGGVQCLADPHALLDTVCKSGVPTIAIDRLLISTEENEDRLFVQHPDPTVYYAATYPVWCFSLDGFIRRFEARGYRLVDRFTGNLNAVVDHRGMIFVKQS